MLRNGIRQIVLSPRSPPSVFAWSEFLAAPNALQWVSADLIVCFRIFAALHHHGAGVADVYRFSSHELTVAGKPECRIIAGACG